MNGKMKKHMYMYAVSSLLLNIVEWRVTFQQQAIIPDQCDGLPMTLCKDNTSVTSLEWISNISADIDIGECSFDIYSYSANYANGYRHYGYYTRLSVDFAWNRIQDHPYVPVYTVMLYQKLNDSDNSYSLNQSVNGTLSLDYRVHSLEWNTTYVALVCDAAVFNASYEFYENLLTMACGYCFTCFTTPENNTAENCYYYTSRHDDQVILIAVISAFVILGIVLFVGYPTLMFVIFYCCYRHRIRRKRKKIKTVGDTSQRLQSNTYVAELFDDGKKESKELRLSLSKHKLIPSKMIKISKVIGQGEFGVVYLGMLTRNSMTEVVAVKSLKGIFATDSDIKSVTDEILKMEHFNHPNVMSLIGVCMSEETGTGGPSIIMPYMAKGSLLNYLRTESDTLKPSANDDITQIQAIQKLLIKICLQVAKGMEYLAGLKFVHRDLAARNCMIGHDGMIKVGDFGLTEDVYTRNYYRQTPDGGSPMKFPLKWMAIESIKTGVFSEKTDVWSFGVTCWEVFTGGEIPYPGVHPQQVIRLLEDEQRLDKPRNAACSDDTYSLMMSCWESKAINRPTFSELVTSIESQLEDMADYLDLNIVPENDDSSKQ